MSNAEEARFSAIEARLAHIEEALNIIPVPAQQSVVQPTAQIVPDIAAKRAAKSGNWLGIIAIVCFVLAAGFIVKLSIDSGWLTPARQIGLSGLFGFALIGTGLALMRSDRAYASLLPGAGNIVLYLTVFAAHRLYGLLSFEAALLLTAMVSALCIYLYTRIRHDAYPITAAVGAYVAPVILGLHTVEVFSLYYFLLCSVAFATISVWVRSRALTIVSAYLALFVSGAIGIGLKHDVLLAYQLAANFLIFSVGTYLYSMRSRVALSGPEAWGLLPVLLLFYALEYYLLDQIVPGLAPWIALAFATILLILYFAAAKSFAGALASQTLIMTFATIVCFHAIYLVLIPENLRPWLFVLIITGIAFAPFDVSKTLSKPMAVPLLALILIAVTEYANILSGLDGGLRSAIPVGAAALVSLWVALLFSAKVRGSHAYIVIILAMAHVLAVLGFYRVTHDISSLAVSACWLFYAVAVLVIAFVQKEQTMARSAVFVLGLAAGKALLYDAASAPTIVRIVCLILTGAVLYGCGLFLRRVNDWKPDATAPA